MQPTAEFGGYGWFHGLGKSSVVYDLIVIASSNSSWESNHSESGVLYVSHCL